MWSQVLLVLLLSRFGSIIGEKREKRTIGILFRGLIDAVTGPSAPLGNLAYPQDNSDRKTTPRPDSRPQTQIFFVPLPEKQRTLEVKPPAPLKPADLAEIHVHPQLVKQLEKLVRTQAIRGKMIAKRFPVNSTEEDQIKLGDEEVEEISEKPTTAKPVKKKSPMRYTVKILPEENSEKGGVSVTIAVGGDGKIRIIPSNDRIKLDLETSQKIASPPGAGQPPKDVEIIQRPSAADQPQGSQYPDRPYGRPYGAAPGIPSYPVSPYDGHPIYSGLQFVTGGPGQPGYPVGSPGAGNSIFGLPPSPIGPFSPNGGIPINVPAYQDAYPSLAPNLNHQTVPSVQHQNFPDRPQQSYSQVNPYNDFLNVLGLADGPGSYEPSQPAQNNSPASHQITQAKPMKYSEESSENTQNMNYNSEPFPHKQTDSNQRPFFPQPQGFPPSQQGFPPIPSLSGSNDLLNTISNEYPTSLSPGFSINHHSPGFDQGFPHFPSHGHLNFPQDNHNFPPSFPMRRNGQQNENCDKKTNETCS